MSSRVVRVKRLRNKDRIALADKKKERFVMNRSSKKELRNIGKTIETWL